MANTNLNTLNQTFRQLLGNGMRYYVPSFQRDYSWSKDKWDDLWTDILAIDTTILNDNHYMGFLVLQSSDNLNYKIIDGQQRILTISLLILAAINHLNKIASYDELNKVRGEELRRTFIGYLDLVTLIPDSKLTLNKNNNRFFQNYLVTLQKVVINRIKKSEILMAEAFDFFNLKIEEKFQTNGEEVSKFIVSLTNRLFFTIIIVTDELNAYTVFETLNARGVKLSAADLLKNYLFTIIDKTNPHPNQIEELENSWEYLSTLIGNINMEDLLRIYWNSRYSFVRKNEMFRALSKEITTVGGVYELIRNLKHAANIISAFSDKESLFYKSRDLQNDLSKLDNYDVKQHLPLLLALYEKFYDTNRNIFVKVLRMISIISFRYNIICGKNPNDQERLYNNIAKNITNGTLSNISDIKNRLLTIYPPDDEFKSAFERKEIQNIGKYRKILRYILFSIENHISNTHLDETSSKYSIEHIFPENPSEFWNNEEVIDLYSSVNRLGNLMILETSLNKEVGNLPYEKKIEYFSKSSLSIPKRITGNYDCWSSEKVRSNQEWMAKQAVSIWRID